MVLNPNIRASIDAIALGIIQEQERTNKAITPLEIASIVMSMGLLESSQWLQETLATSPDERYAISLLLEQQANLLIQPE